MFPSGTLLLLQTSLINLKHYKNEHYVIMFGGSSFTHHSYEPFCYNLKMLPLSARRDQLATHFFHKLLHPTSCLRYLLPPKRHNPQMAKLRRTSSLMIYHLPEQISLKTRSFCMHYIIMSNLLLQFIQFIHYPPTPTCVLSFYCFIYPC